MIGIIKDQSENFPYTLINPDGTIIIAENPDKW